MANETFYSLMVDLHRDGRRQGPGSIEETLRALLLSRIDQSSSLKVADIGCGTGASTITLAQNLPNANITAVDIFSEFLDVVAKKAKEQGLQNRIQVLKQSMDALSFYNESLDLIWSEGAIYNIGFKNGIELWKPFLKTGGVLAVSEITWLHPNPPEEIKSHWESEYPEIATAPSKIRVLETAGYDLLGYFVLPESNWLDNYYMPTQKRIQAFSERHAEVAKAHEIIAMERHEYELYERYKEWFSYGFYVATRR